MVPIYTRLFGDGGMIESYKSLIANQYEASLCTLNKCIEACPEDAWYAPVVNLTFCQVAFHTLFFTDLYLGSDVESQRKQDFHLANVDIFADYEELEPRRQTLSYDRQFILSYVQHCRETSQRVVHAETEESLGANFDFGWVSAIRSEFHLYNIRHIQHHAAQLSLRLRIDHEINIPWVGSGWK